MKSQPITHSTGHYKLAVKLEDDTLLLQLFPKGQKSLETVAQKKYVFQDLPKELQTLGSMKEVSEIFRFPENFEIDPQSATVTVRKFGGSAPWKS